jgi:hypothetical protein
MAIGIAIPLDPEHFETTLLRNHRMAAQAISSCLHATHWLAIVFKEQQNLPICIRDEVQAVLWFRTVQAGV